MSLRDIHRGLSVGSSWQSRCRCGVILLHRLVDGEYAWHFMPFSRHEMSGVRMNTLSFPGLIEVDVPEQAELQALECMAKQMRTMPSRERDAATLELIVESLKCGGG